ncbi:MAG TPA: transglutaminaseTgpA domain-containing protein [Gammaproteobacteria bacterium]|nr:transglutaminaseTgpA domain-containing protein [Gammaproteobacteria bacterium]
MELPLDYERRMDRQRLGWSLLALGAMAAPHVPNIAAWITAVAALLALWRMACTWRGWKLPSRRLLMTLAIGVLACVLITYRTINGPEPGAALLLLLATLKLMESKGLRDYFLVMITAYFIGLANFLYDQTVPLALYMIPAVWLTTVALLNVAHPDSERSLRTSIRATGRLLLPALPLAAVLFLLFPRISGPLWGFAAQKHSGVTGLSGSMSPGDLSELAQSDDIAFRVRFDGAAPPPSALYWRAMVLHYYDGKTWSSGNLPWRRQLQVDARNQPIGYQVTLEPTNLSVLYALDLPSKIPEDTTLSASYEIDTRTPITQRMLYRATSYTDSSYGADTPRWMLHRDLALPNDDPRTHALATQWRSTAKSPEEVVQDALTMFHDEKFTYTLQPGVITGDDRVDQFLFDTRKGFCEHYAGAFVFLMRAAGIPAHVVIGYQGGTLNSLDGYYVIRQLDAHAWAEVWLNGKGWVRVDPTAAVDPTRVERGMEDALPDEAAGAFYVTHPWFGEIRNSWDALNTGWNQWVLAYGPELQERFYKKVGLDYGDWLQLALVLGGCIVLTLGGFWLYLLWERRRPAMAPVIKDYARFCARLARLGYGRAPHEGPLDYARRVARERPDLEREVLAITDCYIGLRYLDEGDLREFGRLVRAFKPSRPRPA